MPDTELDRHLEAACQRRAALVESGVTDAYRVLNGAADSVPGLVIDRFGSVLIAQFHEARGRYTPESALAAIERLHRQLGTRAVYAKHFVRDRNNVATRPDSAHHDATPWIGEPVEPEIVITENAMRFRIRPYDGFSVGLFLEHRDNRLKTRGLSAMRSVLNLFAYTCGFSVAAAMGGSREVSSVDLARKMLEWGKANFQENGIDAAKHLFFASDTLEFFKRAARQGRTYDLIVMDPPTFSRTRRPTRVFELEARLPELFSGAIKLLAPGGTLFFATNHRQLSHRDIEAKLREASSGRPFSVASRPGLPVDFAGDSHYSKSLWVDFK